MHPSDWKKRFRIPTGDEKSALKITKETIKELNAQAKCFSIVFEINESSQTVSRIAIQLRNGKKWEDAYQEAWQLSGEHNPHYLTNTGLKLWTWLQPRLENPEWIKASVLPSYTRLAAGFGNNIDDHFQEIKQKCCYGLQWESHGDRWHQDTPLKYRFEVRKDILKLPDESQALNPSFDYTFYHFGKSELDTCQNMIYRHLLSSQPQGTKEVFFIWINTLQTLQKVFPRLSSDRWHGSSHLENFFEHISLHPELSLDYDFGHRATHWHVTLQPMDNWKVTLQCIQDLLQKPSARERYGLSTNAAKLVEWIESLSPDQMLYHWTPVVEEEIKLKIGIKCPWDQSDWPLYLQMLLDEINNKTHYDLSLQSCIDRDEISHRVRLNKKIDEEQKLIRTIQMYGLAKGKFMKNEKVEEMLTALLKN